MLGKKFYKYRYKILFIVLVLILIDLFAVPFVSTLIFISLIGLVLFLFNLFGFKRNLYRANTFAKVSLFAVLVFSVVKLHGVAEKSAIWAFVFLVLALIHQIDNYHNNE